MESIRRNRLNSELLKLSRSYDLQVQNANTWIASTKQFIQEFQAPEESIYHPRTHELQFTFSEAYPMQPPNVRFMNALYHVNIDGRGQICLDLLTRVNEADNEKGSLEALHECIIFNRSYKAVAG